MLGWACSCSDVTSSLYTHFDIALTPLFLTLIAGISRHQYYPLIDIGCNDCQRAKNICFNHICNVHITWRIFSSESCFLHYIQSHTHTSRKKFNTNYSKNWISTPPSSATGSTDHPCSHRQNEHDDDLGGSAWD